MKKAILILVTAALVLSCAPKKEPVMVKVTTTTTIEKIDVDAINKATANAMTPRIQKMLDEVAPLVERSKKIGKTDFTNDFKVANKDFEAFKMMIDQGKYAEAIMNGSALLGNLVAMQTTISDASQSGKRK